MQCIIVEIINLLDVQLLAPLELLPACASVGAMWVGVLELELHLQRGRNANVYVVCIITACFQAGPPFPSSPHPL